MSREESDVAALRELLAEATPGPWRHLSCIGEVECVYIDPELTSTLTVETTDGASAGTDAALIAAAVNALPALLDALEAATERVRATQEAMQTKLDRLHEDVATSIARAESAEAAYRAMFRQFEAMRDDRDRLRDGVEALDRGHQSPCTHPDDACPCVVTIPLFDLRALLADRSTR